MNSLCFGIVFCLMVTRTDGKLLNFRTASYVINELAMLTIVQAH